jgi:hypothetical protein
VTGELQGGGDCCSMIESYLMELNYNFRLVNNSIVFNVKVTLALRKQFKKILYRMENNYI